MFTPVPPAVNEILVKISKGAISVSEELTMDDGVYFSGVGQVVKSEDKSNQDGTINRIFTIKGIEIEVKKKE